MNNLGRDLRFGLRSLLRNPGFSLVVALTLALGIGANTGVFTVAYSVLLEPLPFEEASRLINVWSRFEPSRGIDYPTFAVSPAEFSDYRRQNRSFEDLASWSPYSATVSGAAATPERVSAVRLSASAFRLLRLKLPLGSVYSELEDRQGADLVLLEYGYWQSRFGGDPAIVGKRIRLNGRPTTIIGVTPKGFSFPSLEDASRSARIWTPSGIDPDNPGRRSNHNSGVFGRLAEGVSLSQAEAEMSALMKSWETEHPHNGPGHYLFLRPLIEDSIGDVRRPLWILLAASSLVLLLVCANVAGLILARGEARQREIAVRRALGAGRWGVVRLLLSESLLLALTGGLLGAAMAGLGTRLLIAGGGRVLPRIDAIRLDLPSLLFALMITLATLLLVGLFPAVRGASSELVEPIKEGSGASVGRRRLLLRRTLMVAEVALAFQMVLGAGLVLKGFVILSETDPGFQSESLLVGALTLAEMEFETEASVRTLSEFLVERLEAIPGVQRASISSNLPILRSPGLWGFSLEGKEGPASGGPSWDASFAAVRPGFFEVMGVELIRGRSFEPSDSASSQRVAIVSQSMAEDFFPGEDPIGRRILVTSSAIDRSVWPPDSPPWLTIVGVVGDLRFRGLDRSPRQAYYGVQDQMAGIGAARLLYSPFVVLKTSGPPMELAPQVRSILKELAPNVPLSDLQSMDQVLADSLSRPRLTSFLSSVFAVVALVLGATGIYGLLAYAVSMQTRSIGIRKALGAGPRRLVGMVVGQGLILVLIGLAVGVALSFWAVQLLSGLLFGVPAIDLWIYAAALIVLSLVGAAACIFPTLRALKVDALVALRTE